MGPLGHVLQGSSVDKKVARKARVVANAEATERRLRKAYEEADMSVMKRESELRLNEDWSEVTRGIGQHWGEVWDRFTPQAEAGRREQGKGSVGRGIAGPNKAALRVHKT